MKLQQLQYFQVICKYQNISRASEELLVSQPALTASMKALEDEFGVELFVRRSKGMIPTEAGKVLMEESASLLEHAERLERVMKNYSRTHAVLRIGVAPMNETIVFPQLFREMKEQYPTIRVEMTEVGSVKSLTLMKNDTLDAAVVSGGLSFPADICSQELMTVPLMFCTYPAHPLSGKKSVTLGEIGQYPLALLGEETYLTSYLTECFHNSGIDAQISMKTNQLAMIGQLIRDNVTSSVLFSGILGTDTNVYIPIEGIQPVPIYLIWKNSQTKGYPVSCLIKAAAHLRQTPVKPE